MEHLRREGWFCQLFGKARPIIIGVYVILTCIIAVDPSMDSRALAFDMIGLCLLTLMVLAILSIIQLLLRKQRFPRWTQKAVAITGASMLLTMLEAFILLGFAFRELGFLGAPFLILFEPLNLAISWLLFWPIDRFLKRRILRRAAELRAAHDLIAIGITGSVGKTTTKELIAHILADRNPLVTPAHVNTEMGVAQWLARELRNQKAEGRRQNRQILIAEMGAYAPGEIATLCRIVQPTMGVVTYIGSQHLALFGSQEQLIKAKGELLEALPQTGHAFLNGDCAPCRLMKSRCRCPVTLVGTDPHHDLHATHVTETENGLSFRIGSTTFQVPIHGTHNSTNVLFAVAVAQKLGMTLPQIKKRLSTFEPPKGTFNVRTAHGVLVLDDTHNASEASMRAAIEWAREQPEQTKILLTPGIIELGPDEAHIHEEMGKWASDVFDAVYCLNPALAKPLQRGFGKPVTVVGKRTAIDRLAPKTLLVCVGRMPKSLVDQFLPATDRMN